MEEKIEKTEEKKAEVPKTTAPKPEAPKSEASTPSATAAPRTGASRPEGQRSEGQRTDSRSGGRPEQKRYSRPSGGRNPRFNSRNRFFFKKKVCFFCKNKDVVLDYKDVELMRRFIAESGKISPRRFTGTCAKHQRKLSTEIKKARQMALIPFTERHQI